MPAALARHRVVHRSQESVGGPDVRQHFDVELARKLQSPGALARFDRARQPFGRVAIRQIVGVEVDRLASVDGQHDRAVGLAFVVDGVDAHLARLIGVVDDPCEPFANFVRCRWKERNRVASLWFLCSRSDDEKPSDRCREHSPRLPRVETVHLRVSRLSLVLESGIRGSWPCEISFLRHRFL